MQCSQFTLHGLGGAIMAVELRAIDLDEVFEDENLLFGWVGHSAQEGRVFAGYSGNMYSHTEYGNAEIYSCLLVNEDEKRIELERFDIQVSGPCVWKVRFSDMSLKNETPYNMVRLSAVKNTESGGFTIMQLINADVLPSFLEDDEIEAQVVAYAIDVNYYADEDAFADTIPECEGMKFEEFNGHKLLPAMGSVFPNGFMHGHLVKEDGSCEQDDSADELVAITGVVKSAYVKSVQLNDETIAKFIVTRIDTQFGELDIVHSRPMISDEEASMIKEGAIVQAVAILSGDVAINEYENGFVKDHKNDLAALRYALIKGNASRLKLIMTDDVVYESVNSDSDINGKECVIERLDYIHANTKSEYFGYLATLENDNPGERVIILAENEEDNLTSIVRIDVNEDGLITKIKVSNDSNIKFKIDERPVYHEPWEEDE